MKLRDNSKAIMVIDMRYRNSHRDTWLNTSLIVDRKFVRDQIHAIETTVEVEKPAYMKVTTVQYDEDIDDVVYHDRYIENYEILEAHSWKDIMRAL